jgi:DNA-binding LacI/PurR family transcriptional regulator
MDAPPSTTRRQAAPTPPTAHDVARLAGVSQSAVSRAFTPGASVSAPMRQRVLAAATALGYRPNLIARSLITRRTSMVGVAIGGLSNQLYPALLEALAQALEVEGFRILLFTAPPDGDADPQLEQIIRYRVDALVLAATTLSSALADECRAAGIPVVLLNRRAASGSGSSVTGDNRLGAHAIARFMARAGHRRPAFIAGTRNTSTSVEREAGFRAGCAESGLPEPIVALGDYSEAGARRAMTALLTMRERPDAVFCASDQMALSAIDVARYDFGLGVPADISIAGFDDAPPAAWPGYSLTTWSQPIAPMAEAVVRSILSSLADPGAEPRHTVVPGKLIVRGSCRLPPG